MITQDVSMLQAVKCVFPYSSPFSVHTVKSLRAIILWVRSFTAVISSGFDWAGTLSGAWTRLRSRLLIGGAFTCRLKARKSRTSALKHGHGEKMGSLNQNGAFQQPTLTFYYCNNILWFQQPFNTHELCKIY